MFWEVSDRVYLQAKAVTDDEFEEAMGVVPETLAKKRRISPESDTEADPSESQCQQSKKKRTARLAETDGSGSQTGECLKASYLFDSPC